jgi:hypothetical protein
MPDPTETLEIQNPGETGLSHLEGMFDGLDKLPDVPGREGAGEGNGTGEHATEADRLAAERNNQEEAERLKKEQTEGAGGKQYPDTVRGEKARAHFDKLSSAKQAAERERDDFRKKYQDLETKSKAPNTEFEKLKAEHEVLARERDEFRKKSDELGKVVALKAIEETDAFHETVLAPRQEAAEEVKSLVDALFDQGDEDRKSKIASTLTRINAAIHEPNKFRRNQQLSALCTELDAPWATEDIKREVDKYLGSYATERKLREERDGNQEFVTRQEQEKEAKTRLERSAEWTSSRTDITSKLEKVLTDKLPVLKEEGMADAWKAAMDAVGSGDAASFDALPTKEKVYLQMMGHLAMPVIKNLHAQLQKERATIAARNGSRPGGGHGGGGQQEGDKRNLWDLMDDMPGK